MDKIESKFEVLKIQENCLSLEDMPNEILANIISYLDRVDIKDILRTAHVSKGWETFVLIFQHGRKWIFSRKKCPLNFFKSSLKADANISAFIEPRSQEAWNRLKPRIWNTWIWLTAMQIKKLSKKYCPLAIS